MKSEFQGVLDEYLVCHRESGATWLDEIGPPHTEAELAAAQEQLGGPPWPSEVLDIYRWTSQVPQDVNFYEIDKFSSLAWLVLDAANLRGASCWYEDQPERESTVDALPLTVVPSICVDRDGDRVGRVWSFNLGDVDTRAPNLSVYFQQMIESYRTGELVQTVDGRGFITAAEYERRRIRRR